MPMKITRASLSLLLLASAATLATPCLAADGQPSSGDGSRWAAWRGPDGNGTAPGEKPPVEWSEEKNVRWKRALPGLGHATPVIWGDRIYVTTAVETDREGEGAGVGEEEEGEEPQGRSGRRGGRGGWGSRPAPTKIHEFVVLCLDRESGEDVWQSKVTEAVPHEAGHSDSTQASNSPLTDGEHIYAFFGSRGIHCLDMEGELQWSREFGLMRTSMQFGEGASPALHGDSLVITWDHEGDSFIVALDKGSGDELWRRERDEPTTWATPLIVSVEGKPQVIVPGTGMSRAYDLKSGEVVWSLGGMTRNCIPSPNYADGVVYLMSGFRGNSLQAVRLEGAKGDLIGGPNVLWTHDRKTSYVPSALLYDGLLYFLSGNSGSLTCMDAETGDVLYEDQRLDGVRSVYSSPVGADGRVYITSRKGATKVLAHGREYEELATNQLDDGVDASLVIVDDRIYLRGTKSLYCIAVAGQAH